MPSRFEITTKTIIYFFLVLAGGWLVFQIKDILVLLFVSFIFMSALRPGVDALEKKRMPRVLAALLLYILVIGLLVIFGSMILPPLVSESVKLVANVPAQLETLSPFVDVRPDALLEQVAPITRNIAQLTIGVFSNLVTVFTVAVLTFYFLMEHKQLHHFLDMFVGEEIGKNIAHIVHKIEERLGAWVRGQLLLMLIIGLGTFLGLTILGVPYTLALAILAGLLEVVPFIGPIISAVPAVLVALTVSPTLAFAVIALYFLIQQLENNLIVPSVMQRAVGIPPLASLLALMIGGRLAGTIGIVLAVPMLLILQTGLEYFLNRKE